MIKHATIPVMNFRKYFTIITTLVLFTCSYSVQASTINTDNFGANIDLRQRWTPSNWNNVLQAAQTAGITWGREEFSWDNVEPKSGEYSFTQYDSVVQAYQQHNIQVLGLLTYSSKWAASNEFDPPDLTAWQNYVGTVAAHYKDSITYWEIWNEPNQPNFWHGNAQQYAQYLAAAATAIKAQNPNAKIVLGGLSGSDADFLAQVYQALPDPNIIDIVAIHPYRLDGNSTYYAPETTIDGLNTLQTDLYNVRATVNHYETTTTPIWFTEVGWTTSVTNGVSQELQADYLVRLYALAASVPGIEKIFWYNLVDDSSTSTNQADYFGLYTHSLQAKLAMQAYSFLRKLNGYNFTKQILPQGAMIDNFRKPASWKAIGQVCTHIALNDHANSTMQVQYHFTAPSNCYAPLVLNKRLPTNTQALQFKVKGDDSTTLLRVRVTDSTGETFQYNLGYLPSYAGAASEGKPSNWLTYTVQLNQFAAHWGGDNNGVLDGRLTFNSFILNNTNNEQNHGTIMFDSLQASTQADTYLLQYNKDDQTRYLYWNANTSGAAQLFFKVNTIRATQFLGGTQKYSGVNGVFTVPNAPEVSLLKTL